MVEKHPFSDFVPNNSKYLILGSFVGKVFPGYDWYYSNKVNQFWPILEKVYSVKLGDKNQKQELLRKLHIALTDIISSCERRRHNNMDNNLTNMKFNKIGITKILKENEIQKIFFTSKFVEKLFQREFKELIDKYKGIQFIALPSPSPRYAQMDFKKKVNIYKKSLPKKE